MVVREFVILPALSDKTTVPELMAVIENLSLDQKPRTGFNCYLILMDKRTTIFRQLIFNVVLPAILGLLVLGIINYTHTKNILLESNRTKNKIITDELKLILEMQDMAMDVVEEGLDSKMKANSRILTQEYFGNTDNIVDANLLKIREKLGMDPNLEDIYVINKMGIIVNTTFDKDRGLNLFSFGEAHKKMLETIFADGVFVNERFSPESQTKRLRKYSYQPTPDGKYIIELGFYSSRADTVVNSVKTRINELSTKVKSIVSVDLFIGSDVPFSLNKEATIDPNHLGLYRNVLSTQKSYDFTEEKDNVPYHYEYIYMLRKNTHLYKESVIRIISDRTDDKILLRKELMKFFVIFGVIIVIVVILIYKKTKVITDPVKNLLEKVNRITDGHLNERADIVGNNEIASLSEQFNTMIGQLESYTNELEEKVRERTAEIMAQKEEIEAQRDSIQEQRNILSDINRSLQKAYHEIEEQKKLILDSIHYARRIQNAILPPDEFVQALLPDSFVLYKPKDIVSGDFYWMATKNDIAMVAAVDCTGHGVPGAFMSIVGHNQLNFALNVKNATRPDEILNALNEGVTKTLRQTRLSTSVRDGMDISLLTIDYKNAKLNFAGANNPCFLLRNDELIQIKPDRFPIGGYMGEQLKEFTNNEMDLQKGDVMYLFSDGYVDQFGGEDDSKFMVRRFRELLLKIYKEPMFEQKEILNQIHEEWRGKTVQIDDILVIGIRF
jgi:phosphoserine phosphatase RsbU/P